MGGGSDQQQMTTMYSPAMSGGGLGVGYPIKTEFSAGNGGPQHIGALNPNFMANKSFDSHGAGYYNTTVPTQQNGEGLFTEHYGMAGSSPMLSNDGQKNKGGMMSVKQKIYFGGNVSMQSSNGPMSRISDPQTPYDQQQVMTSKFKDGNSIRGGLSDMTSNNGMDQDGQSMRSQNEMLKTPSSMMGSHNGGQMNTSQYLLTSPIGQRKDTAGSNISAGPRPIKSMLRPGEPGFQAVHMSGQKSQHAQFN